MAAGLLWLAMVSALGSGTESLSWMAGCWEGRFGPLVLQEQWSAPAGGMLMGMSRNLKDGRVVFSEFMRIETRGDDVVYVARIGDRKQQPTQFKLVKLDAQAAVFENPEHDFPQRIIYKVAETGLFARIEGKENGKERGEDYPMKAVPCTAR